MVVYSSLHLNTNRTDTIVVILVYKIFICNNKIFKWTKPYKDRNSKKKYWSLFTAKCLNFVAIQLYRQPIRWSHLCHQWTLIRTIIDDMECCLLGVTTISLRINNRVPFVQCIVTPTIIRSAESKFFDQVLVRLVSNSDFQIVVNLPVAILHLFKTLQVDKLSPRLISDYT